VPVSRNPVRRLLLDLPRLAGRHGVDVVCTTYSGPLGLRCPLVVVVHDVSFKRHPEWFSPRDRVVLNAGVGLTVRRAAAVITLSEFSRREIETFYPMASGRIHVTPLAPAERFGPDEGNDEDARGRYGIRPPYVLAVGNLQPRKNLLRLIEAFGRLSARSRLRHDLVLVGKSEWQGSDIGASIARLALSARVKSIGYVSDDDLPAIYRGADLFVYPSLYEGFGLPVLEAMACGTPVVASKVSAIPETAGEAAWMVDPRSVDELAAAVEELCVNAEQRARWRLRGLERSRAFTWDRTARQTLELFQGVASRSRSTSGRGR
jgi:glycosyltransferase involved in cell wall biosynthesis